MNFNPTRSSNTNNNNSLRIGGGGGSPGHSFLGAAGGGASAKYIYDLPYLERKELCRILDENNQWEMLGGGLMCYTSSELNEFSRAVYRGGSPTDVLLTAWGSQNHTILELFTLLGRLHHFRGMRILANFVDPKYHVFIRDTGGVNVTAELIGLQLEAAAVAQPLHPEPKVQNVPDKPIPGEVEDQNKKLEAEKKLKDGAIAESIGLLPAIPYEELLVATDNWDRRYIIGKGGFGTVFRGMWKNTAVAIKRMEQRANQAYAQSQFAQSLGEMKFLNSYRHDNILPLYGYCLKGEHPCIVYQYMVNGSLEDRLLCRQRTYPLNWTTRYTITRGVACGIQFLHSIGAQPLIHGDIKSANILLDKNFEAKVGDFGLAREMTPSSTGASYVKVSRVHGTRPYLPDEYLRSKKLSTKVDTFSFGIMLFEIITGMRAYEESRQKKYLKDMFDEAENPEVLKDQRGGPDNPDAFWILVKVAKACTVRLAKERPEMVQVLKSLEGLMSQASLRTVSSHVTGLPLLFETRAGSLMPTGTSTTHRLSPVEMRTPSPHWIPPNHNTPNQTPRQVLDSVSVRRSPLPSARSPLPVPAAQAMASQPVSIPEPVIATPPQHYSNNNTLPTPPAVVHQMNMVGSAEAPSSYPQPPPPLQISPPQQPPVPVIVDSYLPAVLDSDDQYLPLVLNRSEDSNAQESDADGPATVIPLITELGIKD